jgi:hypothetical protein
MTDKGTISAKMGSILTKKDNINVYSVPLD